MLPPRLGSPRGSAHPHRAIASSLSQQQPCAMTQKKGDPTNLLLHFLMQEELPVLLPSCWVPVLAHGWRNPTPQGFPPPQKKNNQNIKIQATSLTKQHEHPQTNRLGEFGPKLPWLEPSQPEKEASGHLSCTRINVEHPCPVPSRIPPRAARMAPAALAFSGFKANTQVKPVDYLNLSEQMKFLHYTPRSEQALCNTSLILKKKKRISPRCYIYPPHYRKRQQTPPPPAGRKAGSSYQSLDS